MVFETIFGCGTERRVFAGEVAVLLKDGVEDTPLKSLVEIAITFDSTEDTTKKIDRPFLHRGSYGPVGMIGMNVARDSTAAEEGSCNQSGNNSIRLTFAIMSLP
jgi:hypothetical protein